MKVNIPPIKCQGIKSKLVPWIKSIIHIDNYERWIEPFMGSGVVGFNIRPKKAVFCDSNPHIINFYNSINTGKITPEIAKVYLEKEGKNLSLYGEEYYYKVRQRFNDNKEPLDFLFLNRSCFNGVIRFNNKGEFNVPFGHKPKRFSKSYITKIVNQINYVYKLSQLNEWIFLCQDFRKTLLQVTNNDIVYCDPPYAGRHVDYFNSWNEKDEKDLYNLLKKLQSKFILSTWHSNEYRENKYLKSLWSDFNIITKKHFYHVGAKESNRKPMLESLVVNFNIQESKSIIESKAKQLLLLETQEKYL